MLNLSTIAPSLSKQGIYGPVTSTLDWCELNHQFSPYIAELANTLSNLVTIVLAIFGSLEALQHNLPTRYIVGYAGIGLVGVGSFLFHATLLFEAQLADELPMIYVSSMGLWLLFDNKPGFGIQSLRTRFLVLILILFDAFFTWTYINSPNPVYHEIVFGFIVISSALRITYILQYTDAAQRIPQKKRFSIANFFSTGAGMFAFGFLLWNLDNIFCHTLTNWKIGLGWPQAFLLEGHSWWHVLTGLGTYYMFIGIQYVTLCTKDDPQNYDIHYRYGLPHLTRVGLRSKAEQKASRRRSDLDQFEAPAGGLGKTR